METRRGRDKQLLSIILLLAALVCILGLFFIRYCQLERDACVARLQEYAEASGQQIRNSVENAQTYLSRLSGPVYERCVESEMGGRELLSTLENTDMISRLELLMPDDTLYTSYGRSGDPTLSYEKLARQEVGITRRALDQFTHTQYIVRIFVPVRQNGQTVAILCGVVETERLPYLFPVSAYGQLFQLSLVERETGNYLMDSRRERPGNLRDAENYVFLRGHSKERYLQAIQSGASGYTVIRDPATSENYDLYYTSADVQDWTIVLSVPERVSFAQANTVMTLFALMALLIFALVIPFFLWFFRDVRQRQARNEIQLQGVRYILEVQQTLFRAHMHTDAFHQALEEMAGYLTADVTVLYFLDDEGRLFQRSLGGSATKAPPKNADFHAFFPHAAKAVMEEGHFAGNRPYLWGDKDWDSAREIGIRNMMLVRLDTLDGSKPLGVLGAINVDVFWEDTAPLDQVALTFTMALENYQNYQTLARLGQVDELTGLMNRNYYQTRLEALDGLEDGSIGCIYLDANGLHEINNHLGHDAGDEMLRSVADALLASFDKSSSFRLGGDEFVVLVRNMPQAELERKAKRVADTVEKCGYSVSVGLEWREKELQIQAIVAAAEAAMRKNKAEYYAKQGGERQMRNLNNRLEQTLSAKQDADDLLSYLAPNFLGVYFVSPQKDACRALVSADFFKDYLDQAKGSFQGAMDLYIHGRVAREDQQTMLDFCHYDSLVARLAASANQSQELFYHRSDGQLVRLLIRQPRRAGDDRHELMWMFSMAEGNKG